MKTNYFKLSLIGMLFLGLIGLQYACESSTFEEASGIVTNPSYNKNVKPIMTNNCTGCHNGVDEFSLLTYEEVKDNTQNGNLLCRIKGTACGEIMPPTGKMNTTRIAIIENWAANNYPLD